MPRPDRRATTRRAAPTPIGASALPRHRRPSPWTGDFLFGVAYYPEQWEAATRSRDPARMRAAGVNTVRMGEFAWDVFEPREGEFDFALFDETITRLARAGIKTILGTPTAAPPRWLTARHPEILRETPAGQRVDHGGRQHASVLHHEFRVAARRITTAMATHYRTNPHVVGWQLDNEYHVIGSTDYSDTARAGFQAWLAHRYETVEALNEAWGMAFSAGTYGCFSEVPLPLRNRPDNYPPHPGHLLDFHRFTSDATCVFHEEQVAILRAARADWFLFHNGLFPHLDYWRIAAPLDWLGIDLYPDFGGDGHQGVRWAGFKLELCRAHSGSFVVPELASGAGGAYGTFLPTPEPGQMRLWAWQCIAHGADAIIHFRWRTCRAAVELNWHGVIDHDDVPRRRFAELTTEAAEIARLAPHLAGTTPQVDIGVLVWNDADEQHDAVTRVHPRPRQQAEWLLGALLDRHLAAGLVHAEDELDGLKAVIAPSFAHVPDALAARLARYVHAGGRLIVLAGTGTRDLANRALPVTPPGPLAPLLGVTIEESGSFRSPLLAIRLPDTSLLSSDLGYEILAPRSGTEILAQWNYAGAQPECRQPHPAIGRAAITQCHAGRGRAITVGCRVDQASAGTFVGWLHDLLGWTALADAGPDITVRQRASERTTLTFVINHALIPQRVGSLPRGRDLIDGCTKGPVIELPPLGVAVIRTRR